MERSRWRSNVTNWNRPRRLDWFSAPLLAGRVCFGSCWSHSDKPLPTQKTWSNWTPPRRKGLGSHTWGVFVALHPNHSWPEKRLVTYWVTTLKTFWKRRTPKTYSRVSTKQLLHFLFWYLYSLTQIWRLVRFAHNRLDYAYSYFTSILLYRSYIL